MASKRSGKRKYDSQSFPEILDAIRENRYSVVRPIGPKFKVEVTWAKWRQIFDEADKLIKDFYYCISCEAIYNINISNSGRCLKKHALECSGLARAANRIEDHFAPVYQASKRQKVAVEDKLAVKEAAIKYIVSDMRPIMSIKGNGLKSLLATMTSIGAKYGAMNESDLDACRLIPSRATVSHIQNVAIFAPFSTANFK